MKGKIAMKNRILSLIILASMLTLSCGGEPTSTETTASDTTAAQSETTSLYEPDSLPELDFGGEDFLIFAEDFTTYNMTPEFISDETGDIVSDAVFKRNQAISERLNLNLKYEICEHVWDTRDVYLTRMRTSVLAAEGEFDLVAGLSYFIPGFLPEGLLLEMTDLPYIDTDKPWWSKDFMEKSAVDGKYYFVTGDASLGLIKSMFCIFENLELAESVGIKENLYDTVREGKWTLDKLAELTKLGYGDLNGNSEVDRDDRFGFYVHNANHITGFIEALGVDFVRDGSFVFDSEANFDAMERLISLVHETDGALYDTESASEAVNDSLFRDGDVVFATGILGNTDVYRELDFTYGVLPYPKLDESDDYATGVLNSSSAFALTVDCPDVERSAAVLEAYASESYRTVTPAYFETALKVKYSRDDDSSQMFDFIRENIEFDFGYIYTAALGGMCDSLFRTPVVSNKPDLVSATASKKDATVALLDDLLDSIRNN